MAFAWSIKASFNWPESVLHLSSMYCLWYHPTGKDGGFDLYEIIASPLEQMLGSNTPIRTVYQTTK